MCSNLQRGHNPFIIFQEKSEATIRQEQLSNLDGEIRLQEMYTEPTWKDSSYPTDRKRYEDAVEQLKSLNKQRAALEAKPIGRKKSLQVHIVEKLADVLEYPDECVVLKQWPGKWHSDFFKLTVGMLREKTDRQF